MTDNELNKNLESNKITNQQQEEFPSLLHRTLACCCQSGGILGMLPIIFPAIILAVSVNEPDKKFLADHAKQSLVAQIFTFVSLVILFLFTEAFLVFDAPFMALLTALMMFVIGIGWLVCSLIGTIKALTGEPYQYPLIQLKACVDSPASKSVRT